MRDWMPAVSVRMSSPATEPSPELGRRRPASILMVVVFPAPFGPSNPKISPRPTPERRRGSPRIGARAPEPRPRRSRRLRLLHGLDEPVLERWADRRDLLNRDSRALESG